MAGRKKEPPAAAEDGRKSFELDEQLAESFRAAVDVADDADSVPNFWRRAGEQLGFDPASIIVADVPEKGPIAFTAVPLIQGALDALASAIEDQGDDEGEGTMPAIERLGRIAEDTIPEGIALVRFASGFMLDQIKHSPRWDDLLEAQQRDLGAAIQENAGLLVERIVQAVRSKGAKPIKALLESYSEKEGLKASIKVKADNDADLLQAVIGLHEARGKIVLITVASKDDFNQDPGEITVDPDEPGLGFDAGSDDHPDDDSDLAGEDREDGDE